MSEYRRPVRLPGFIQVPPEPEPEADPYMSVLLSADAEPDADEAVYPRRRRSQARTIRDAAISELPEVVSAVTGPDMPVDYGLRGTSTSASFPVDPLDLAVSNAIACGCGDGSITYFTGPTMWIGSDGTPRYVCMRDTPLFATGPVGGTPEAFVVWNEIERKRRAADEEFSRYIREVEIANYSCTGPFAEYIKMGATISVETSSNCAEPVQYQSYNPFHKYLEARVEEGAAAVAASEMILNPYGGYLGEDDEPDISYGPYQEIKPYISPGEKVGDYIQKVYSDATITDAEMKQISDLLAGQAALRPQVRADTLPGERDPIIAGAGFGATLCMSYVACNTYPANCNMAMCPRDDCVVFEDYCGGPKYLHPPNIFYWEPSSEAGGWRTPTTGDLFMARVDQCYFECVHRRERENSQLETPLEDYEIAELCEPERCLPAYCMDHHMAAPNNRPSYTSDDPRVALAGRSDEDICRVAWVLANGWGIDDNNAEWWNAWTDSELPVNGYDAYPTPIPVPPQDECDGRYGNWVGKPCAFARLVTQMAVWAVQQTAPTTLATGGIFMICPTNPGNLNPSNGPFNATMDRAFHRLVAGANTYAATSECTDALAHVGDLFTGPTAVAEYPNGDLGKNISAATPYPPRSLRDLNLPVVSNCNADAQSITACATDTMHLFWTSIPNEVRVVCGRVIVGPFRLHSTKGSADPPNWQIKNTCGCNPEYAEFDETGTCAEGEAHYHTTHCSNLFSFVDFCGNPICCDPGPFDSFTKLPEEPCLDQDFYIAVRITGRYMCFTLCVEITYKQVVVLMFPLDDAQSIGTRCPNLSITPEVACICVCVETPQEEPGPDLFPPPAVFPPPPNPSYTRPPQTILPQPFLVAPPPPPRPPKPPEFPPPIVIPPPPPPPPMPPRVVQPVIIPPPRPPQPPERMPPCEPLVVQPPPLCPTLPEIPPPAPVIVLPPAEFRKPVLLPAMPQLPPSMRGARPARLNAAGPSADQSCTPWPQRPLPPINGAPPAMPGYESSPIPGMPSPWPITPPPNGRPAGPIPPNPFTPGPMRTNEFCNPGSMLST
ncbi:hypothetical protein AGMMS49992_05000 [Clostridia bacterium]|nr:hypothetical protein AGMMS49992_05000 [Clostridia bacterium]